MIRPRSHIVLDSWATYAPVEEFNPGGVYSQGAVIYQQDFADPDDDTIHIQEMEYV